MTMHLRFFCLFFMLIPTFRVLIVQTPAPRKTQVVPRIESCDCQFKIDPGYLAVAPGALRTDSIFQNRIDRHIETTCGYLIVPENRKKGSAKTIKLPFIIVKSKNTQKKNDPVLFTSGGPGNSSLGWANAISRSSLVSDRDCIAFEQRGTRFSIPYIRRFDLDQALKEAYRKNLSKDSMTLVGVKKYKRNLEQAGVDLSGYNTDETVADIHDLLSLLKIDSVNLIGGSYSGGLMLAVLQKDPDKVRSMVLDSPLPTFIAIDEDEPANFVRSLDLLFDYIERDSTKTNAYKNLKEKFDQYFRSIVSKKFYLPYVETGTTDTLNVEYTKNELLDIIINDMGSADFPILVTDIIHGDHDKYIRKKMDDIFRKYFAPDGMRISVYCADQAAYHSQEVLQQFFRMYPYMEGYHINDVYKPMCDCWNVPPISPRTKQPFYSDKPALIVDGEMDQACSPLYMSMVRHYMPNAQCFLFKKQFHGVGGRDFNEMIQAFINNPYKKIEVSSKNIIPY
jgi:pimeloyl-ACP methyl ester carboxylesterase